MVIVWIIYPRAFHVYFRLNNLLKSALSPDVNIRAVASGDRGEFETRCCTKHVDRRSTSCLAASGLLFSIMLCRLTVQIRNSWALCDRRKLYIKEKSVYFVFYFNIFCLLKFLAHLASLKWYWVWTVGLKKTMQKKIIKK